MTTYLVIILDTYYILIKYLFINIKISILKTP